MSNQNSAGERAQAFFDDLWRHGDCWELETSPFERAKYTREMEVLSDRRYGRVLEIGCGAGAFTRLLARAADHVLALDVSPIAIERARAADVPQHVEFRIANIMDSEPEAEGACDLVVINETIYYLGWLYSFFDVTWLGVRLFGAVNPGGRVLMANTLGNDVGYLLKPPVIRTYRDLFLNAGFSVEHEETFQGVKDDAPLDVLITVFQKP